MRFAQKKSKGFYDVEMGETVHNRELLWVKDKRIY